MNLSKLKQKHSDDFFFFSSNVTSKKVAASTLHKRADAEMEKLSVNSDLMKMKYSFNFNLERRKGGKDSIYKPI